MLVPVRIGGRSGAGGIQCCDLIGTEIPADGPEVRSQLGFVARADDEGGNRRPLQQPVERDLWNGLAGFPGNLLKRIHNAEKVFIGHLRADGGIVILSGCLV